MKTIVLKGITTFISGVFYSSFFLLSFNVYSSSTLNVLNWDDYLSEDIIKAWEEKTGVEVRIITYDDEEIRDVLLTDTVQHQIDLAIVDARSAKKLANLGYVINLGNSNVQGDIDPYWRHQCGEYAIPYLWGTLGIAYRSDKVAEPVLSWGDLFSTRQDLVGHIGMISDYYSLTAPALLTLRLAADTDEEKDLKQAYELLKKQTHDVLTYEYAPSYLLNSNRRDDLYVAVVYSGDQYTMNDVLDKEVWHYVLPEEGSFVWLDCWIIPVSSKKQILATSFLKFIGQSKNAAINSEDVGVATVDLTAYELQSEMFRKNELIYPEKEKFNKLLPFEALSDLNIRQRIRIQEAIKVIHESE